MIFDMTRREKFQLSIAGQTSNQLFQLAKRLLIQQYAGFYHNSWKLELIEKESINRKLNIINKAAFDTAIKIKSLEEYVIDAKVIDIKRIDYMSKSELITFLESAVGAGKKNSTLDLEKADKTSILKAFGLKANKTFICRISGDSMKNANIINGSNILVDASIKPKDRNVVVASIFGELFVKRYRLFDKDIWLYPENEEFEPVQVTPEMEISFIGVVKKVIMDVE